MERPETGQIDSPIHQLRIVDEAVSDTGTGMMICFGIKDFVRTIANKSGEEIEALIREVMLTPERVMGERPEAGLPILTVVAFVEDEIAEELSVLESDEGPEVLEE